MAVLAPSFSPCPPAARHYVCSVLTFHAHVASALPFKRGDEPCALIYSISSLIASKAESILAALRPCYPDAADADRVAANGMVCARACCLYLTFDMAFAPPCTHQP